MTILDLFSRRQKRAKGDAPDVYQYDELPHALRVQIVHVLTDGLGTQEQYDGYGMQVSDFYKGNSRSSVPRAWDVCPATV
jgi:hypothetical protein